MKVLLWLTFGEKNGIIQEGSQWCTKGPPPHHQHPSEHAKEHNECYSSTVLPHPNPALVGNAVFRCTCVSNTGWQETGWQ